LVGQKINGSGRAAGFSPLWLGVLQRSTFERVGFEASVPRWDAPPKVRFATDPALERAGFELAVPRKINAAFEAALFTFAAVPVPPERPTHLAGADRRFESLLSSESIARWRGRPLDEAG